MRKGKEMETNFVTIAGRLIGDITFSHECNGESFYRANIETLRLSGVADIIPVIIPGVFVGNPECWKEKPVRIRGRFQSLNKDVNGKRRMLLYVFVREIEKNEKADNEDEISLEGYICKQPNFRTTPRGRQVTDLLVAVNRPYQKSDYIPCVTWGRLAQYSGDMVVGEHVKIEGRIQSRTYHKKISEDQYETRTAYEVSANYIAILEDKYDQDGTSICDSDENEDSTTENET